MKGKENITESIKETGLTVTVTGDVSMRLLGYTLEYSNRSESDILNLREIYKLAKPAVDEYADILLNNTAGIIYELVESTTDGYDVYDNWKIGTFESDGTYTLIDIKPYLSKYILNLINLGVPEDLGHCEKYIVLGLVQLLKEVDNLVVATKPH